MIFVKVKEGIFRKPDGTLVLSVIYRVGGDAPPVDFSDMYRYQPSSWPKGEPKCKSGAA